MIFDVKPAVVGHRGFGSDGSRGYRENSLESFLAAEGIVALAGVLSALPSRRRRRHGR